MSCFSSSELFELAFDCLFAKRGRPLLALKTAAQAQFLSSGSQILSLNPYRHNNSGQNSLRA
jgi:hypothetical protein